MLLPQVLKFKTTCLKRSKELGQLLQNLMGLFMCLWRNKLVRFTTFVVFTENIRLVGRGLPMPNTLAYRAKIKHYAEKRVLSILASN
jgi:hypothetical protein